MTSTPGNTRHETAAVAAPCIHLSCPVTRQTIPDPTDPTTPIRRARSASALLAAPAAHCSS
eukprot:4210026-Prymnesium_polylepis.1